MKINILGTDYEFKRDDLNNPLLVQNDGVCRVYEKEIIVRKQDVLPGDGATDKEKKYRNDHVIRHELVHAFSEESGASYGNNEELVDWIAAMIPKINSVFEKIREQEDSAEDKENDTK